MKSEIDQCMSGFANQIFGLNAFKIDIFLLLSRPNSRRRRSEFGRRP